MLGVNFRRPLLTGFNRRDYDRLWHRGASCPAYPAPCDRAAAASQEPDDQALDGALLWLPGFRDSCDDVRGYDGENGTVVSLDNNAAVPLLFAALAERAETAGYMACLQGQGALVPHPVCRNARPLPTRLGPEGFVLERSARFKGLWSSQDMAMPLPPMPPPPALATGADATIQGGTVLSGMAAVADASAYSN